MDLSASQLFQLNAAAAIALLAFLFFYMAPPRWIVPALVLIVPFEIIASKYGSLNIYLIYLVGGVLFLRRHLRALPYIGFVGLIGFAYAISLSQVLSVTMGDHLLYLVFVGSGFLLFYIIYNYYRTADNARSFLYLLVVLNGLILVYSLAQLAAGLNPDSPLFSGPISLKAPREDGRLTGPFGVVSLTAEYMVMAVFICGYLLLSDKPRAGLRAILIGMILGNFATMIATANRGALFSLAASGAFFFFLFRRELGFRGIMLSLGGALFSFALAAALVINYSDFNLLFDRLSETEVEEGVPDTRAHLWPIAWSRIQERPLFGHGPQLVFSEETYEKLGITEPMPLPHSIYLFLLYTLGAFGLVAYLLFWSRLWLEYYSASRFAHHDLVAEGLPRLAMVLMVVFLIDQIKIEFLRPQAVEFQHLMFVLWGALAALTGRNRDVRGQLPQRTGG